MCIESRFQGWILSRGITGAEARNKIMEVLLRQRLLAGYESALSGRGALGVSACVSEGTLLLSAEILWADALANQERHLVEVDGEKIFVLFLTRCRKVPCPSHVTVYCYENTQIILEF